MRARGWLFINRRVMQTCKPGWVSLSFFFFLVCPQISPSLASPLVAARALLREDRTQCRLLCCFTPSLEGDTDGTPQPGVMAAGPGVKEPGRCMCHDLVCAPMWLVEVCREVVKSTDPDRKYPQG